MEQLPKKIIKNGISYTLVGDYYFPDLQLPKDAERPLGRWARLHRDYLKRRCYGVYVALMLSERLWTYLAEVDEQADALFERLVEQMKATEGVTEELKAADQMAWVGAMNNIRSRAEEIVLHELIYGGSAE